jgi:hypothetical protein
MVKIRKAHLTRTAKYGILLGIAGGIAEIIWVASYGQFTGGSSAAVARGVSATVSTVLPAASLEVAPVAYGIVIHMVLAAGLGVVLVFAWRALTEQQQRRVNEYAFMAAALATVWAFNFFILLPLIDPAFVALMPYPASLLSKLLFGLAGAVMLRHMPVHRSASIPIHVRVP